MFVEMFAHWTDILCVCDDLINVGGALFGLYCDIIGISHCSLLLFIDDGVSISSMVVSIIFSMGVFARVFFWCMNGDF